MNVDGSEYSPAEILMSRKLRSILPIRFEQLKQKTIDFSKYNKSIITKKKNSETYYNRYVKKLNPLIIGEKVVVQLKPKGEWSTGTVTEVLDHRAYKVKMNSGKIFIRNRKFIKPIKNAQEKNLLCSDFLKRKERECNKVSSDNNNDMKVYLELDPYFSNPESENDHANNNNDLNDNILEYERELTKNRNIGPEKVQNLTNYVTSSGRLVKPPQRLDL